MLYSPGMECKCLLSRLLSRYSYSTSFLCLRGVKVSSVYNTTNLFADHLHVVHQPRGCGGGLHWFWAGGAMGRCQPPGQGGRFHGGHEDWWQPGGRGTPFGGWTVLPPFSGLGASSEAIGQPVRWVSSRLPIPFPGCRRLLAVRLLHQFSCQFTL